MEPKWRENVRRVEAEGPMKDTESVKNEDSVRFEGQEWVEAGREGVEVFLGERLRPEWAVMTQLEVIIEATVRKYTNIARPRLVEGKLRTK